MPSNLFNKETVSSINENSQNEESSQKQQTHYEETSAEGLTLKELPSHLKYEFLEPEKRKPVIISAALTEAEKQKLLVILRKYKRLLGQLKILRVLVPLFVCTKYCWKIMQKLLLSIKGG